MKSYGTLFILIIIMSTVLTFGQNSKSTADGEQITPLPKGVSIYQLDNGMEALLIEKPGLPMTGVNVEVNVGSAYETFASSGMSHMLEHLLFNGTDKMTQKELYDAVDMIGGYNNAHTDRYFTNFMMVTPAENIEKGMEIQAGMLFNSVIPDDKFPKEKGIVLEEIAKSLGKPDEQINRNIISVLYPGHALSLPTLGTYETIEAMKRDDVYRFYKNFYVPNNMRLTIIGDFKTADMLDKIKAIYGKAEPGNVMLPENTNWATGFSPVPVKTGANAVYHRFYSGANVKLQLFYPLPNRMNERFYELLENQLDEKKSDLQAILKKSFPDMIAGINLATLNTPVASHLEVTIDINHAETFDGLIWEVNQWIDKQKFDINDKELESDIVKSRTAFLRNTEKPHMFGIYNSASIAVDGFRPITDAFRGNGYRLAARQIKSLKIPDQPLVLVQYPEPADTEKNSEAGTSTKLLKSDGKHADLIVREVPNGNILAIHILLKHKAPLEEKYGKDAAQVWNAAYGSRIQKEVLKGDNFKYGFKFTVNDNPWIPMDDIYMHPDFAYIRAEGLADDIPGAIAFLTREMATFVPTEAEFKSAMGATHMAAGMRHQNKAQTLFNETWQATVYENNEKPVNTQLDYQKLLEFGKIYFHPANMVISVISPASAIEIEEDFRAFQGKHTLDESAYPQWSHDFRFNNKTIDEEKEANGEQTYLFYGFMKKTAKEDEAPLRVLGMLLRDDIVFDIRETRGMAYRMSAGIDQNNGIALFYIRFGTKPENAKTLKPIFASFFNDDFTDKIKDIEVKKALNMYLGRMMFRRLSSINQGFYLGDSYYLHGDYNYDEEQLENLKKVTTSDVIRVAEKYLDVENPILIVVK